MKKTLKKIVVTHSVRDNHRAIGTELMKTLLTGRGVTKTKEVAPDPVQEERLRLGQIISECANQYKKVDPLVLHIDAIHEVDDLGRDTFRGCLKRGDGTVFNTLKMCHVSRGAAMEYIGMTQPWIAVRTEEGLVYPFFDLRKARLMEASRGQRQAKKGRRLERMG